LEKQVVDRHLDEFGAEVGGGVELHVHRLVEDVVRDGQAGAPGLRLGVAPQLLHPEVDFLLRQ
jgi:hypothetical protein